MKGFECGAGDDHRFACDGLSYYGTHDYTPYCVLHFPSNEKWKDEQFIEALDRKRNDKKFDYSGVYFPRNTADFAEYEFTEDVSFYKAIFEGSANFTRATFSKKVDFSQALFKGEADFRYATFNAFDFTHATGRDRKLLYNDHAGFNGITFKERATFRHATFNEEVFFHSSTFERGVGFYGAEFKGRAVFISEFVEHAGFVAAAFEGRVEFLASDFKKSVNFESAVFKERTAFHRLKTHPQTVLEFTGALVDKPDQFSFHTTYLRPGWFVDVNCQEFDFSDVEWFKVPNGRYQLQTRFEKLRQPALKLRHEVKRLSKEAIPGRPNFGRRESYRKLSKVCQRLMNNAEAAGDYPTANTFHYWSMEASRKESRWRFGPIATLYWLLSGYGVRPGRAFSVLLVMWAMFSILYWLLGPTDLRVPSGFLESIGGLRRSQGLWELWGNEGVRESMTQLWQAAIYSLSSLARLNPVPKPSPGLFQLMVTIEGILGPLQIALLALAIRRKVMR